jgi:hypothetical protein
MPGRGRSGSISNLVRRCQPTPDAIPTPAELSLTSLSMAISWTFPVDVLGISHRRSVPLPAQAASVDRVINVQLTNRPDSCAYVRIWGGHVKGFWGSGSVRDDAKPLLGFAAPS